jgi:hypothetical protein
MIAGIAALLFAGLGQPPDPAAAALAALRAQAPVELLKLDAWALAGRYQVPPAGVGGLAGDELHLFPDGSYLYCEWADVWPLTVHDKGRWKTSAGLVELESDPDITWSPGADRRYVVVRRTSHPVEVLLFGIQRDLAMFDKVEGATGDDLVLWASLSRGASYKDPRVARRAKADLMHRAWRPDAFRRAP